MGRDPFECHWEWLKVPKQGGVQMTSAWLPGPGPKAWCGASQLWLLFGISWGPLTNTQCLVPIPEDLELIGPERSLGT